MTKAEIKKRYTQIRHISGKRYIVDFKVQNQYFHVVETDEGKEHAVWFQKQLVTAIERLIAEAVVDKLDELGVE